MTVTHVVITLLAVAQVVVAYALIRFSNTTEKHITNLYHDNNVEFRNIYGRLEELHVEIANGGKSEPKPKRAVVKKTAVKAAAKKAVKK